jgi:cellulase/cellobiase CelA1
MHSRLRFLGLVFVSALACGGCDRADHVDRATVAKSPLVSGSAEVTFAYESDWGAGYCLNVSMTNHGTRAVTSWTVVMDTHQSTISQLWNGIYTTSGSQITVGPMSWNATVSAGVTVRLFGFCATSTGADYHPTFVSLDVAGGDQGSTGGASGTGGSPSTAGGTAGAAPVNGGSHTGGAATGGLPSDTGGSAGAPAETGGATLGTGGTGGAGGNPSPATVDITLPYDWGTGYCATVTITNHGSAVITDWTVVLELNQAELANIWNSSGTTDGTLLTAKPLSFTSQIAVGGSAEFGYCATATGPNYQPVLVSVEVVGGGSSGGTGGASSTGGAPSTGGVPSAGGTSATGGVPSAGGTSATGGIGGGSGVATAAIDLQSDWGTGYCANVRLSNNGTAPIIDWTVELELDESTVNNLWSGTFTTSGSRISVQPLSWNSTIASGGWTDFGFCANVTGPNYEPWVVSLVAVN